uniref:Endonuclease V n=1 Tax=Acrobeloides nanus TaxID=290746 RepID=A0A914DKR5_9BILA
MHSYFNFLYVTFFEDFIVKSAKIRCLKREQKIKDSVEKISNLDSIHYIGGLDISICTTVPDIAIISYSVMEYPGLEPVFTDDQVVYLPVPYIPEYLIIREAEALVEIVLKNSHIPVDVLLIDGNGRFHSRRCGLATHVGYLTGIPTIGVSKSFLSSVIINDGFPKEEVNSLENKIHEKCRALKNAAILSIDGIDADLVRIVRPESSVNPLYVSSGYMIDLETATTMVIKCLRESIPEPIRLCDLRSRALVDKFFNV